jgi:hypothetical protein
MGLASAVQKPVGYGPADTGHSTGTNSGTAAHRTS